MEIYELTFYGGHYEDRWEQSYFFSTLEKATDALCEKYPHYLLHPIGWPNWCIRRIILDTNEIEPIYRDGYAKYLGQEDGISTIEINYNNHHLAVDEARTALFQVKYITPHVEDEL